MLTVCNAFSLQMINQLMPAAGDTATMTVKKVTVEEARQLLAADAWQGAVGHPDIARIMSAELGVDLGVNRINVVVDKDHELLVGQYVGGRLPEGATALPEGATINWFHVTVA